MWTYMKWLLIPCSWMSIISTKCFLCLPPMQTDLTMSEFVPNKAAPLYPHLIMFVILTKDDRFIFDPKYGPLPSMDGISYPKRNKIQHLKGMYVQYIIISQHYCVLDVNS